MFKSLVKDDNQHARKSSFWGIRCESGKKYSQIVNQKYHISMAALDPTSVKSGKEVVSLVVERDGSEFLLCNLQKESVLQVNLNLFFDKGEKVVFSLKGQGIVHLTGYLIKDYSDGPLQSKTLNDSIMLAKDKVKASGGASKNVQFKKNLSTQNDSWKIESKAIPLQTASYIVSQLKKTRFPTNITGLSKSDVWTVESDEGINSASQLKKNASPTKKSPSQNTPQKKLFGASKEEDEDSSEDDDDDDDEDDDDEDEASEDNEDAKQLLRFAQKRPIASLDEEDDDDEDDSDFEIDSSDESEEDYDLPAKKKQSKDEQNAKKLKVETSTPLISKKTQKPTVMEVIELDDDSKNGDMNSSIGRTPMPKKKSQPLLQKSPLSDSKKPQPSKDEESSDSDSDEEMETSTNQVKKIDTNKSASQLNTSSEIPSSEKKKKKKKKKKKAASADDSTAANQSTVSANESFKAGDDMSKLQFSKKLPGGAEYTDIRVGNGLEAKKGRLVHVYYTGKLADNKVFDARQAGKDKPFAFKLGAGNVIKGWDMAIEGMKVGGKRRIKIPPHLGYKNQRLDGIPANSTLYFLVQLVSVS